MKAFVLAAGVGSRLRPLTDKVPKALVDVGGRPMLARVIDRLKAAGVTDVIVNAFHLAEQVEAYARSASLGVRLEVSREEVLLDTGGGLKKAGWFFDDGKPFFIHNVDVLSEVDLGELYRWHLERDPLTTLSVRERPSKRAFLFEAGRLVGRDGEDRPAPAGQERLPFDGIHVVSPRLLPLLTEEGVFSISDAYVRLAQAGHAILAHRSDRWPWLDIGGPAKLSEARRRVG